MYDVEIRYLRMLWDDHRKCAYRPPIHVATDIFLVARKPRSLQDVLPSQLPNVQCSIARERCVRSHHTVHDISGAHFITRSLYLSTHSTHGAPRPLATASPRDESVACLFVCLFAFHVRSIALGFSKPPPFHPPMLRLQDHGRTLGCTGRAARPWVAPSCTARSWTTGSCVSSATASTGCTSK